VFAGIARAGGIRRGATALDLPRSTVSRQLAQLERAVGGRLVARSTRHFKLTDLGAALLEQSGRLEDVLQSIERVAARSTSEPMGKLSLATSEIIAEELLPEVIADYLARYPGMQVDVQVANRFIDLRRGRTDLAIRTGPLQDAADLFAKRLGASLKGHYASPSYLKARGIPKTPADLARHDCIVIGDKPAQTWTFGSGRTEAFVDVSGRLVVDSYAFARRACIAGVGIARLPSLYAAPHIQAKTLVPVLDRFWPKTVIYAVHAQGQPAPPKIRAFIELTRKALARTLE